MLSVAGQHSGALVPDSVQYVPGEAATLVRVEQNGAVLRLTLDNPPANALSVDVMRELRRRLDDADQDASVRVVVIAAAGKLFSGGHDLKEMTAHRTDGDAGKAFFEETFAICSRLMQSIVDLTKPVIAEVDGVAAAAGCQLVASCDLAVASDRARFGVNGINVGLFCTTPGVALLRVAPRKRAMEMLLTGKMIDAAVALEIGLVNRVVAPENLRASVDELAATIAAKSPDAIRRGKQALAGQPGTSLAEAYEHASRVMVDNLLSDDAQKGIRDFLAGRHINRTSPEPLSRRGAVEK
jgi:enoyl-CoA hydratase/carnithine racemase